MENETPETLAPGDFGPTHITLNGQETPLSMKDAVRTWPTDKICEHYLATGTVTWGPDNLRYLNLTSLPKAPPIIAAPGCPVVTTAYMQDAINRTPKGMQKVPLGEKPPRDGQVIEMVNGGFLGRGFTVYRTKYKGGEMVSQSVLQASLTKPPCQRVFDAL